MTEDHGMEVKRFISEKVDRETRKFMEQHDCDDYSIAMHAVLDRDPLLKSQYTDAPVEKAPKASLTTVSAYTQKKAGDQLNELALDLLSQSEDVCDYSVALRMVMAEHPDLARKYAHG
jgi:hypothetical protein